MPLIKFWFVQSKLAESKAFPLPTRRRLLQWYMPSPENITFTSNEWAQYGCTKERKNVKIKADYKSVSFSVLFKARGTFSEQRQRFCFEAPPNNFPTKIKYYYLTRYLQYCYVHLSYNWCLGSGKLWGRLLAAKILADGRGRLERPPRESQRLKTVSNDDTTKWPDNYSRDTERNGWWQAVSWYNLGIHPWKYFVFVSSYQFINDAVASERE